MALVISVVLGIPLGLIAGLEAGTVGGRSIMAGSILGFSLPNFWLGMMLILVFAVVLGWLPAGGRGATGRACSASQTSLLTADGLAHLILPALNLALFKMSLVIRLAARGDARGDAAGLRQVRPRQGPVRAPHRRRARAEEHPDPDRHRARPRTRLDDRLRGRHRDGVRLARHGQAADRLASTCSTGR